MTQSHQSWRQRLAKCAAAREALEDELRAVVRVAGPERVAQSIGSSKPAVYEWLRGERGVSLDWLRRLSDSLDNNFSHVSADE